jgi:hypothetical protein
MSRPLITITLLFSLTCIASNAQAQKRGRRSNRTRAPQAKVQPPPQPAPPQKSQDIIEAEKELTALTSLSADDKAAVREALEVMDRKARIYKLRGYDKSFLIRLELEKVQDKIDKAFAVLPPGRFKTVFEISWNALLEAWIADDAYMKNYRDDKLLELIEKYKIDRDEPAVLIGRRILERAIDGITLLTQTAIMTGIMPQAE